MKILIFASNNSGKLQEVSVALATLNIQVLAQSEQGIAAIDEPHTTFVENAIRKARHASIQSGQAALADDSGLCVAALHGKPGIHSARYSGITGPSAAQKNTQKLLQDLESQQDRRAYFYSALVLFRFPDDSAPIITTGTWHGEILTQAQACVHGFGYDPIFWDPKLKCCATDLPTEIKNTVSHRGIALRAMHKILAADPLF